MVMVRMKETDRKAQVFSFSKNKSSNSKTAKSGRAKEDIEQHTFNVVQHNFFDDVAIAVKVSSYFIYV